MMESSRQRVHIFLDYDTLDGEVFEESIAIYRVVDGEYIREEKPLVEMAIYFTTKPKDNGVYNIVRLKYEGDLEDDDEDDDDDII